MSKRSMFFIATCASTRIDVVYIDLFVLSTAAAAATAALLIFNGTLHIMLLLDLTFFHRTE